MTAPPNSAEPPSEPLGDLVARYVEILESQGVAAAEAVFAEQPHLAKAAREQIARLRQAGLLPTAPEPVASAPQVAHYTILERLGSGGMGEVYLAEQREPVRRRVALKVIKLGMASRDVLARFDIERQALALMSHANIARVLDAGTTDQQQPYFAMEYVPGLPITGYCDQRRLSTRERLELMLAVCDAVQHAHYKGIIHRDLKPSNVLVMELDGRAAPKIIDFGVAKAVAVGIGSGSVFTLQGMVVGTPEYMSPEQAGRGALDVDTRTDVYSLGVMLYELLTGSLPFPSERLRSGGLEQMLSIIRDEPPPRPSTRVSRHGPDTQRLASARSTDLGSLRQHLRGDLDWIVLKALEKDRNRRYQTPALLADDLRRFLANEPIAARPPSFGYLVKKFVRRNRLAVALAAAVLVALGTGLVVSLVFYRRAETQAAAAERARGEAEASRTVAQRNFDNALQVVDDLLSRVGDSNLVHVPQMEGVRRDLLQRALRFYQDFAAQRSADPRVRLELASALDRVGRIEDTLGNPQAGVRSYRSSLEQFEVLLAAQPDDVAVRERQAAVQVHLAYALKDNAGPEVRDLLQAALQTLRDLRSGGAPSRLVRMVLAEATLLLADLQANQGGTGAVDAAREGLAELEAVVAADSGDIEAGAKSVLAMFGVAQFERRRREWQTALELLDRAEARARELLTKAPERVDLRRACCLIPQLRSIVLDDVQKLEAAEAEVRESVRRWRELSGAYPLHPDYRASLAYALLIHADTLQPQSAHEFEPLVGEALDLYEALRRDYPDNVNYRQGLANALVSRGMRLSSSSSDDGMRAGLESLRRGREAAAGAFAVQPDNANALRLVVQIDGLIGGVGLRLREPALARESAAASVGLARELVQRRPDSLVAVEIYAGAVLSLARSDLRDSAHREVVEATDMVIDQLRAPLARDPDAPSLRRVALESHSLRGVAACALGELESARTALADLRALARQPDELLHAAGLAATIAQTSAFAAEAAKYHDEVLANLRAAVAAGFADRAQLERDARFAVLRGTTEFTAILDSVGAPRGK